MLELLLLAVLIGGNESSRERTFQGVKVPHLELSLLGVNDLGSEKVHNSLAPLKLYVSLRTIRNNACFFGYLGILNVTRFTASEIIYGIK